MKREFDGMYIYHPNNKHDEWDEENQINREAKKREGPRVQGMVKNQLEIVEVKNNLTLSS